MAVALGAVTSANINAGANATTVSFTSTNQPLYVRMSCWRNARTLNTVTFGGVSLARVAQSATSNADDISEIWRLLTPSASTANIVATWSGNGVIGAVVIANSTGQDTGTPEGTAATAASSVNGTGTGNLTVSASSGDLHIAVIAVGNGATVTPAATGGSPTEERDAATGGETTEAFKVDGAANPISGSWTGSTSWSIAAIPLKQTVVAFDPTTTPPLMHPSMIPGRQQIGQY